MSFDHAVSLAKVRPVTEEVARAASRILAAEGLHGHECAVDAMLAATAHLGRGDVTVVTSDTDDPRRLCPPRVAAEPIRAPCPTTCRVFAGQTVMGERGLTDVTSVPNRILPAAAAEDLLNAHYRRRQEAATARTPRPRTGRAAAHPETADTVFRRLLRKPGFTWAEHGGELLRGRKPWYYAQEPRPGVSVIGERLGELAAGGRQFPRARHGSRP
ncbi:type II toxin-antitoxin system VapC family toxin [Kitasatospora cineracea]|uniref:Uncharacterized protein n=1 Tax=Kitasatospora cineracea TaxID=88074 RepID=A0A8G1UFT8_9ACTN|nr:hypothetical protein [Kitasatospora cineracea]ROR43110.1 hypothetical protein EDD39_1251 [Kitasatospora cineracea]